MSNIRDGSADAQLMIETITKVFELIQETDLRPESRARVALIAYMSVCGEAGVNPEHALDAELKHIDLVMKAMPTYTFRSDGEVN